MIVTFRQVEADDIDKYKDGDRVQKEVAVYLNIGETATMVAGK